MTRALITGITGQDGSYLADLLLDKGYEVFGLVRQTSRPTTSRIQHALDHLVLIDGDVTDLASLCRAVEIARPDEVYHLAAQSFVGASFHQPLATSQITGIGTANLLEAVRLGAPDARVYHASSSEMFGLAAHSPQTERTPFHPRSPYGIAKVYAHGMAVHYREAYGLHASCGICFNHESPRRGLEFVTRKISWHVALIHHGLADHLDLGNLDARRDWGWAPDYVAAMWRMLQQPTPDDYVLATGQTHSVRDFVRAAFAVIDRSPDDHVRTDPALLRPSEVPDLRGDPSKAREALDWRPTCTFDGLVERMVEADLREVAALAR